MKTYTTKICIARLAAFLFANIKPFHFDGFEIEFMASDEFIRDMKESDPEIGRINFKVQD